jgi:hypothetical protein
MPYKDPDKRRNYRREWARKNRRIKSSLPYHKTKKKMIFDAKDKPCAVCKQTFPVAAMDLHHTDPTTKEFTIATALKKGWLRTITERNRKMHSTVCRLSQTTTCGFG